MTHDEWRLKVRQTIGSSAAGASIGKGRFRTRRQLYDVMVAARDGIVEPEVVTDDMRRGHLLEPIARELLTEKLGLDIRPHDQDVFVVDSHRPWAHALPDAWLPGGIPVEIKVPRPQTVARCTMHGLFPEWTIQCEHMAAICGAPYTQFAMLDPVSMRIEAVEVHPDPMFVAALMRAEAAFFVLVESRTPPEPDEIVQADEWSGDIVKLDSPEIVRAAENYARLYAMVDEVDDVLAEARNRLAVLAGCHVVDGKPNGGPPAFEIPGVLRIYHKQQAGRRTFDQTAAVAAHPDLEDPKFYKTGKPFSTWRPYIFNKGD